MSSTFEDLSQSMSSDEKKELLGKIQTSLNLTAKDTDNIVSKAEGPENLKNRLSRELTKLGIVERFFLKLSAFFRNRSETEILADKKLAGTKAVLREKIPGMVNFTRGEWSPEFAKMLYDLYSEVMSIKPVFDHLFQQKFTLEAGVSHLIWEEYPQAVRILEDILPDREIAGLYKADQRRSAIQAHLDRKLEAYMAAVPSVVFDRVRERLRPLYFLRPLAQFPYGFLLELFGHSPDKVDVAKYPYFLGCPWRKAAALLERMYYGLHLVSKVDWRDENLKQLFQGVSDRLGDGTVNWTVESINLRVAALVRVAQDIALRLPWKEILQWSFQDPYYGVKYVLPRFSVIDFYQTTLTMTFREELDIRIPEVRQQLLLEERKSLFENGAFQPLEYYVPGVGTTLSAQRVQGFQYPESLGLLWGFLNSHFAKKIQPFHQSLVRLMAPGNRSSLQGLNNIVDELVQLRTKLHQFDRSLHPDTDEGKDFVKLKYELGSKTLGLKPYLELVQTKDSQAVEILNRGTEGVQILCNQLVGIRDRNIPALNAALRLPYLLDGTQETMEAGLDRLVALVKKFLFVLKEAQSFES